MQIRSIGIDLGKTTFHLIALGDRSQIVIRKKFSRSQLLAYTANLPSALIGMEAGVGSHFLGRALREQGHEVRLIPAQFVRPFVKSNKNDYRDAEAIAEAVERENMRFVPIKTEDQLDLQALHRVRDRLVARRTSVINQIRAFLLERGISFRKGPASLRRQLPEILENADEKLSPRMRHLLDFLWQEWKGLQSQIDSLNEDLEQIASSDPSLTGKVTLKALIAADGTVKKVKVLSGDPALARVAVRAVQHWQYRTYEVDGHEVEAETNITISFVGEDAVSVSFPAAPLTARPETSQGPE